MPQPLIFEQKNLTLFFTIPYRWVTAIALLIVAQTGFAQNASITGTVTDAASKKRIPGANVFISNTSKGTVSDADGAFELHNIPPGKYELIISETGYQTIVYPFSSEKLPLRLNVQMEIKVKQWETVNVTPFEKNGWEKWGRLFTESFLGQSANAAECQIRNKEVIRFRYNKQTGLLEAVADTLLLIENKALGYLIRYQLEAFECNTRQRTVIYGGYPLFEAMNTDRKGKQKRYASARRKAFYGSTMHFIRALYYNQLTPQGFEVRTLRKFPNEEKMRLKKLLGVRRMTNISGTIRIDAAAEYAYPPDSAEYYRTIMKQPDFYEEIGAHLLTADSLLNPGLTADYKLFAFPYELLVIYKNEQPAPEFLRTQWGQRDPHQTTRMFFITEENHQLHIYPNGSYFDPLELFLNGYMGWEKMAEMLPLEYEPVEQIE